jgi:hypothetical protein
VERKDLDTTVRIEVSESEVGSCPVVGFGVVAVESDSYATGIHCQLILLSLGGTNKKQVRKCTHRVTRSLSIV